MLPVLGRVRHAAKSAQNLSNLRQIGIMWNLYLADKKDTFPGPMNGKSYGNDNQAWCQNLDSYIGVKGAGKYTPADWKFFYSPLNVFPTEMRPNELRSTYSMNPFLVGRKRVAITRPSQVILNVDGAQKRSATVPKDRFADEALDLVELKVVAAEKDLPKPADPAKANSYIEGLEIQSDGEYKVGTISYRDKDAAGCLFVDGHVARMKKGTIQNRNFAADY